jgi:hypothetical protein
MCNIETLEPCNDDECEGLYTPEDDEDLEDPCSTCNKVDCLCDFYTDTYRERDLF